tara:strand:- start:24941 stop:25531 length:591 start_codon:yes stop_codon:yes gene_type:complete
MPRSVIGAVGGITPRPNATLSRPADATQYSVNDHIANSATGSAVLPLTFTMGIADCSGLIIGARCVLTAASGSVVTTAADFDLVLFRPTTSVPFAAGSYPADNAALSISALAANQLVGRFSFINSAWSTSGFAATTARQVVGPASGLVADTFNLHGIGTATVPAPDYLLGLVQAKGTWNPGNVAQSLYFELIAQGD